MKLNLNQITISVFDVSKSIAFYQKLGLNLIVESLPHYARFECLAGESTFSLQQSDTKNTENGICVYFETAELDEVVNELIGKGLDFEQLPEDQTWLWREARLKDLDNNQIILFKAGGNRKNPPWRIDENKKPE